MRRYLTCVLAACIALAATFANNNNAYAEEVEATSRSAGMAGALTGGASGTSAVYHNPAGIMSAMMYSAEAGYTYDARTAVNGITANAVDTKSNGSLGAALSFTYEMGGLEDQPEHSAYHFRGALATALVDGMLKLGATVRYSAVDADDTEVLAAIGLDVGMVIQPLNWLSLGVTGRNLINGGYDEEMPRTIAAGVSVASLAMAFQLGGDVAFDISAQDPSEARTWNIGGEYLVGEKVPLRVGYSYDEIAAESVLSIGGGFRDSASLIGLDFSYQHNLDDDADKVFLSSLSVYF